MDELDMTQRLAATLLAEPPPATESVARGRARLLAEATGQPSRAPRRRASRRPVWIATAVGVAAATAAGTLIALGHAPDRQPSPDMAMTPALRQAILTAFGSASDDIMRVQWSVHLDFRHAPSTIKTITWNWPALPQPGKLAQWRATQVGFWDESAGGTFAQQPGESCAPRFKLPPGAPPTSVTGVDETQRTWFRQLVRQPVITQLWNTPACLRSEIAQGNIWRVKRGTWHGQAALELTHERVPPSNKLDFVKLWLSARTYLPLAEQFTAPGGTGPSEEDFQMLPPTPANLAQLKVRIPAGFRRLPPDPHLYVMEPIPE